MTDSNTPEYAKQSPTVEAAEAKRLMCRTMRAGQEAMIAAREKFLPRYEIESDYRYQARLGRTGFTSYLGEAVEFSVGQVFAKEMKYGDDVPQDILGWLEDVDLRGNSAHIFLMEIFRDYWYEGCGLFLADMPILSSDRPLTIDEEKRAGRRPYWTRYPVEDVLGARDKVEAGRRIFTQLRLQESFQVEDGEFGEKTEKRVRVYWAPDSSSSLASYASWKRVKEANTTKEVWTTETPRTNLSIDEIPMVALGELTGEPPLQELAFMNKTDFQLGSDLRNIEYIVNVPRPYVAGASEEDFSKLWAADQILVFRNVDAKPGYWEHSGANIGELKNSIATNRSEMGRRAMRSLMEQKPSGDVTATSDVLTAGKTFSRLQMSALKLQDAAENGLRLLAKWSGKGEDAGGSVEVNKQFLSLPMKDQAKTWLEWAVNQGLISKETAFKEAQRYEALSDSLDWDEEQEKIRAEGPKLGDVGSARMISNRAQELIANGTPEDEAWDMAEDEQGGLEKQIAEAA